MTGRTLRRYRIFEKLGEGGMGEVYRAEDSSLGRAVALKFLAAHLLHDAEAKQRFLREARAAAAITHPNICHVYEVGEEEGKTFLAMAYLEGESLEERIAKGPLPLKDALDIGRQIAVGLEAAHEKGIVHRDIKPANVMVDAKGHATILDFGLARLAEASKLTRADQTVGTAAYMSPEQIQGDEVDRRADIWALGCVLYEMVAGLRPFKGQYDQALLYEVIHEEPEPLTAIRTGVPMELEVFVGKCLAKEAADRYDSTAELAKDLRTLAEKLKSGRSMTLGTAIGAKVGPTGAARREGPTLKRAIGIYRALLILTGLLAASLAYLYFARAPLETSPAPVRRFSLAAPSLQTETPLTQAAISPDGRYIAYVSNDDPSAIWVRSIDREEARALPGTEGARPGLFWSPDSRFVGFATARELLKIAVDGGPAVTVCALPAAGYGGGSWSVDGAIIAFGSGTGGIALYEALAAGGEPQLLFERVVSEKGGSNTVPDFLPLQDGRRALLFTAGSRANRDIYLKNLESGDLTMLTGGTRPRYSPTGHIVYEASPPQGGLWALPFSLEKLEVTGEAFSIAEGLGDPSLAADGTLVAVSAFGGSREQRLVWRDRQGNRIAAIGQPQAAIVQFALSPDGRRLAASAQDHQSDRRDIWIHEADRPVKQRLTVDSETHVHPSWSPDGKHIQFISDGGVASVLWDTAADGGGEARKLIDSEAAFLGPAGWAPDGKSLLYSVANKETGPDIWLLTFNADGEPIARAFLTTPFSEYAPQVSPNGRYLAYVSDESGRPEVIVREFPGGGGRQQVSTNGGAQPRWGRDGKDLFYVEGQSLVAASVTTSPSFSLGETQRLFDMPLYTFQGSTSFLYDVSREGRFVFVEDADQGSQSRPTPTIHIIQNWYEEFRVLRRE